jgi:hypothetical protein
LRPIRRSPLPVLVDAAAVDEHLSELHVVAGSREEPESAALEHLGSARRIRGRHVDALVEAAERCLHQLDRGVVLADEVGQPVHRGQPSELVVGDTEARVVHTERLEQAIAQEVAQGLTREDLDQTGGHVDADAVVPARTRLEGEWDRREFVDQHVERTCRIVHDPGVAVHLRDGVVGHEVVGQAAGVAQQVADLHRARLVDEQAVVGQHLRRAERRQVLGDRMLQLESTLLVQEHQGRRHDGLGHRIDPEDRVRRQRDAGLLVLEAELLGVDDLPPAADHRADADDTAFGDVRLHHRCDARQAGAAHADRFRRRRGAAHGCLPRIVPDPRARPDGGWPRRGTAIVSQG